MNLRFPSSSPRSGQQHLPPGQLVPHCRSSTINHVPFERLRSVTSGGNVTSAEPQSAPATTVVRDMVHCLTRFLDKNSSALSCSPHRPLVRDMINCLTRFLYGNSSGFALGAVLCLSDQIHTRIARTWVSIAGGIGAVSGKGLQKASALRDP